MSRALLSVSDKAGLVDLARGLSTRGFELVSTGGTARALQQAGLGVVAVSDVTGVPEMMDGRVKTLHPRIHGGILARRSHPGDLEAATRHGITLIDVVVVNLYPFVEAAATPAMPVAGLIEAIDIGGPSLVRAAAKNFRDVLVVVSPSDYPAVLDALDRPGGPALEFRLELARKAFAHTAGYDTAIASAMADIRVSASGLSREHAGPLTPVKTVALRKLRDLRYGENPHQVAAWYADEPPAGFGNAAVLQGKELSYTNLLDLDAAARVVLEFAEPAAVVIKHTNPCGAATGADIRDAYERARDADALAAFGGVVGVNRPIDAATARAIQSTFIEAVVAPSIDREALEVLSAKPALRVVVTDFETLGHDRRLQLQSILGAVLVQSRDRVLEAAAAWPAGRVSVVTRRSPTPAEWDALRFAWRVCAHVKSNTVLFAASGRTLAIGAGQTSRVDAVKVARLRAESAGPDALKGSVAASDAFFPFRDGLDAVAEAGATAVVQPGGSVRDEEVIAAADEHGMAMVFTGRRHFRH
jgi:phosphoribosylaminoimidazolecarboxamide formyltransferase/IMP cyclohydrolase